MSGSKRAKSHTLSLCLTGICIIFLRKFFFFKINWVEIELLIQRSDQFRSNKIIKGFFLVYLGFTFFVVWVNGFLVKEVKPSRLYFEWVEGGQEQFS